MSNRTAVIVLLLLALALSWDGLTQDGAGTLYLLRKFSDLLNWIAFWR